MRQNPRTPSLELEQDLDAQRREWRFERAGWCVIAVVMGAALLGLFGDGPLARVGRSSARGDLSIEYDRVARSGAESHLAIRLGPDPSGDTLATVVVGRELLEAVDVERITPEPLDSRASATEVLYRFRRADPRQPIVIDVAGSPARVGPLHGAIRAAGGGVELHQFVLP